MKIPEFILQRAISHARIWSPLPCYIYSGTRYAGDSRGDWGMDQRGQWTYTHAARPSRCPEGQPFICVATVRETDTGIEIIAGRDHGA